MSHGETRRFRVRLDEAGIRYTCGYDVGKRRINADDVTHVRNMTFEEDEDGKFSAYDLTPAQAMSLATARRAKRVIVSNGVTGHCTCEACGRAIDVHDRYCRHCGAELEGGW